MQATTPQQRFPAKRSHARDAGTLGARHRWLRFVAGIVVIGVLAFAAIPGLQLLGPVRQLNDAIHNSGIDATALFYTESEVSFEAETSIRNAIAYPARHADSPTVPPRSGKGRSSAQR